MIRIFIDGSAWNILHELKLDLRQELPPNEFELYLTREVEIELLAIPDTVTDDSDKVGLKKYIAESRNRSGIKVVAHFGFRESGPTAAPFGHGTFPSASERARLEEFRPFFFNKSKRPTGLAKNQADASLAARSFDHIVLTNDNSGGPLADAARKGAMVVRIGGFDPKARSLRDYILEALHST
ncbi:MAG TPA: hypothetical protein VNO35_21210 [Steroidobacteraceae bacterium]|nr:hypothetical protein [Steroidobacteraceae bacterium]